MPEAGNKSFIRPVAFERADPVKIRQAFDRGCCGVIVEGAVPAIVTAEINRLATAMTPDYLELLANSDTAYMQKSGLLDETFRWLEERREWFNAAALDAKTSASQNVLWMNKKLNLPWHIDGVDERQVHVHIHGVGMDVAMPTKQLSLPFATNGLFRILGLGAAAFNAVCHDEGVVLHHLTPGQAIIFEGDCLHRSAPSNGLKMRAII